MNGSAVASASNISEFWLLCIVFVEVSVASVSTAVEVMFSAVVADSAVMSGDVLSTTAVVLDQLLVRHDCGSECMI